MDDEYGRVFEREPAVPAPEKRYLRDVFARIAEHPINRIEELLPWNIAQRLDEQRKAA